ncbi:MAG: hypothetical protein IJJ29_01430 [Solobacterium sp.]|nr:hypothetical protein [Solobacterium sp.]
MLRRKYCTPIIFTQESGGDVTVIGEGTAQGSIPGQGLSFDEWWDEIAQDGTNPDADYNGDGEVNRADYNYYIENHLWDPDE